MIQLTRPTLIPVANNQLQVYQQAVDNSGDFPKQVEFAKEDFPVKNVVGNATFDEVKAKLKEMCSGAERCHYCEDSNADEVEHWLPKDVYPEQTYQWENYLYSCGSCNTRKSNQCAVVDPTRMALINNTPKKRRRNEPPTVPTTPTLGNQAMVNLVTENPLSFFLLDLTTGSFEFAELPDKGTIDYLRAGFTLETLKLNKRAFLRKARKQAYGDFKARLTEYIFHKNSGSPSNQITNMITEIKTHSHPTVWKEMIRQRDLIPELQLLYNQAPEAINW